MAGQSKLTPQLPGLCLKEMTERGLPGPVTFGELNELRKHPDRNAPSNTPSPELVSDARKAVARSVNHWQQTACARERIEA